MDKSGIYIIKNQLDSKVYVGYATNFRKRKAAHLSNLRKNKHKNIHLQRAFNRDGEINFNIELIEEYEISYLPSMENYWCNMLNAHNPEFGYNLYSTGEKGLLTHSEESRIKLSNSHKGKKLSEEHCKNIGLSKKGVSLSEEHKNKLKIKTYEANKKGIKKLNEKKVKEIILLINQGIKTSIIAKQFDVDRHIISKIKHNKMWNFIEKGWIKQNKSRLSISQIQEIREKVKNKVKYKNISDEYNIPTSMISKIKNNLKYGL